MAGYRYGLRSFLRIFLQWKRWDANEIATFSDSTLPYPCLRQKSGIFTTSGLSFEHASSATGNYGPAVKLLVELYGIKVGTVKPTGPHGRLLKGDVLSYITLHRLQPISLDSVLGLDTKPGAVISKATQLEETYDKEASDGLRQSAVKPRVGDELASYADLDLTSMRKTIAKRLTQAKTTIPHAYAAVDCCIDNILHLKRKLAEDGVKVSVNDFIVKACAAALQRMPAINSVWNGPQLVHVDTVDVSVAVATDNGLITPIIKDAASLSVEDISLKLKDLAARAKAGKLRLDEFQGGTFTVSNLGMYGVSEFSAVINPPQVCILAVGSAHTTLSADNAKPATTMTVTLSSDARAVDDALGLLFLETLKAILENPYQLALGLAPNVRVSAA